MSLKKSISGRSGHAGCGRNPGFLAGHIAPLALILLGVCCTAKADLPVARLLTIFPPGARAGTEVEIALHGVDLEHAETIHLAVPGFFAQRKTNEAPGSANPRFLLQTSTNTPPGIHLLRVSGRFGVSNPRPFFISQQPEVLESGTNHAPESAQVLILGEIVNGRVDASRADYYRFKGAKGARILVECSSASLDSRLQPVLLLFNSGGGELARNRRGDLLDFTLPEDGDYVVKIHDHIYGGGTEYPYRLSIASGPRLDFILPPAGLAGTTTNYWLYGRNLPAGVPVPEWKIHGESLERLLVKIELPPEPAARAGFASLHQPAQVPVAAFQYRFPLPDGDSNPVLLGYATAPVLLEQNTNQSRLSAQEISVPCEVAGQFLLPGEQHWFSFEARKGEVYYLEVFSHRLGLSTDPFLLLQRATKNDKGDLSFSDVSELSDSEPNIGGPEFNTLHRDPALRFEVKEDARYFLQVRDLVGIAPDPRRVFRLAIRRPAPDFHLVAMAQPPSPANKDTKEALLWSPLLRRGDIRPLKIVVLRRDHFAEEIQITAEGLPPGITSAGITIPRNKNSATLLLAAGDNVTNWAGPIKITGRATVGDSSVQREAFGAFVVWTVNDYNIQAIRTRVVPEVFIASSTAEAAPVAADFTESKIWETSVAGRLSIPLRLVRRADGFAGPVKMKAMGIPQLEGAKEVEVAAKGTNGTLELDLAQSKLPAGEYSFYLEGSTQGKYARETPDEIKAALAAAQIAEQQAKEAEKTAADLGAVSKEAGEKLTKIAKGLEEAEDRLKNLREKTETANNPAPGEPRSDLKKAELELIVLVQEAKTAKIEAEKAATGAAAKAKEALAAKETAMTRAKEATERSQPKDVTVALYAGPIALRVAPAPITLSAAAPVGPIEAGARIEVAVSIHRLYGYADLVQLNLRPPKGIEGVTEIKGTIPKDQSQTTLTLNTMPNATAGEHPFTIEATLRLNGQELKVEQTLKIKLVPPKSEVAAP